MNVSLSEVEEARQTTIRDLELIIQQHIILLKNTKSFTWADKIAPLAVSRVTAWRPSRHISTSFGIQKHVMRTTLKVQKTNTWSGQRIHTDSPYNRLISISPLYFKAFLPFLSHGDTAMERSSGGSYSDRALNALCMNNPLIDRALSTHSVPSRLDFGAERGRAAAAGGTRGSGKHSREQRGSPMPSSATPPADALPAAPRGSRPLRGFCLNRHTACAWRQAATAGFPLGRGSLHALQGSTENR